MKGRLATLSTMMLLAALGNFGDLRATERVRVLSDIGETRAEFSVTKDGQTTILDLGIPAVEVKDVSLAGGDYKEVTLPEAEKLFGATTENQGEPNLPLLTSFVALPDQGGISLAVEYSGYDTFEDMDIAPAQPSSVEGQPESDVPFTKDEEAYRQDKFMPENLAEAAEPVIMRDVRMAQISLSPVQYNPARRELRVYRDLSVRVTITGGGGANPKTIRRPYLSEAFLPLYRSLISNFDEMFSTADVRRGGYVIITKALFADSLQQLVLWKHRKGYNVRLVRTTEINSNGSPSAAQIYTYLQNAYNSWAIPPEYVMIVGDKDNTSQTGIPDYPYSGYSSDHHYSMLEGGDYLPDIAVVRFSVDNMSQLRVGLAKIMAYETHPNMTDTAYWLRGLSVAGNVYAVTPRITTLWVRQLLLENGFTQVDTSFRWASMEVDSRISPILNNGVSIISYRGWAGPSGWYSPYYQISDLNGLTNNNKLGVMASIVCGTGDFGAECFGETWIRMGSSPTSFKGGPAFFGATDPSTHTRWNNPIMVGYYWGIFRENIYHFGMAALRGKIQQYNTFPRYNYRNGTIEQYFHTYNMLGDPELELRTKIPILIWVTHPDTLPLGINHIEVAVTDTFGQAISGAFVTLNKGYAGNEEVFEVGNTDEAGNVSLSFAATTPDTMFVTVSGRDLYPYRGYLQIVQADLAVGFDSLDIDDDNLGNSSGNHDGQINPGETIELGVALKNFGSERTAQNVIATLEAMDPEIVTVYDSTRNYGDIPSGQIRLPGSPFVIGLNKASLNADEARVKLTVTDNSLDSWYSVIRLPIVSSKFQVTATAIFDSNNRLDPGDSVGLVTVLRNVGNIAAEGATARLTTVDDYTTIITPNCSFGRIGIDSVADNSLNPMAIRLSSEAFVGGTINLALEVTTASGAISTAPFALSVGAIQTSDPVGPDAYGYYMYDNTDAGYSQAPIYQWVEINPNSGGQGTRLNYGSNSDDKSVLITQPNNFTFDFDYYGQAYDYMIVSINGFTAFDSSRFDMAGNFWYNFFNWPIPDPGNASGQISPFWDDLRFSGSNYGVYTWDDTTLHRFIIEWSHLTNINGGATETFQMIVMDPAYYPTLTGDAEFYFQYNTINNGYDQEENYASVGFESPDETRGLEYTYDSAYPPGAATLAAGRAIKITTNTGRGGIRGMVDLANGGFNQNVTVRTSGGQHRITPQSGEYWLRNVPPDTVAVTAETPGYFPQTIDSVIVTANQSLAGVNFSLTVCPIPANLTASDSLSDRVEVRWSAVTHPDLAGYNVYRGRWPNGEFTKLNSSPIQLTQYTDTSLPDSGVYWYYVSAAYSNGSWNAESFASAKDDGGLYRPTGIGSEAPVPTAFFLSQNYPNPFNPSTSISFGLPRDSDIKVEIFNLLGQRVKTLLKGKEKAGYKTLIWNGTDESGNSVSSGVYLYKVEAGKFRDTRKMTMLK